MSELRKLTIEFLKVLADPTRLEIISLLRDNEKSSLEIQKSLKRSQSTISKHLNMLIDNNLLDFEKKNNIKYYKIGNLGTFNLLTHINSVVLDVYKEKLKDVRDADIYNTLS